MASRLILIILSYTVSKFACFFLRQCRIMDLHFWRWHYQSIFI